MPNETRIIDLTLNGKRVHDAHLTVTCVESKRGSKYYRIEMVSANYRCSTKTFKLKHALKMVFVQMVNICAARIDEGDTFSMLDTAYMPRRLDPYEL